VAEAKSGVRRVSEGFDFLGFTYHGRFLRPRPAGVGRFKDEVRARTRRQAPVSLQHMIEDINPLVRGWGNYFAMGDVVSSFSDLDGWIRTRLRSKVRGSAARLISRQKLPNRKLTALGLVSLESMARAARLSPV
jgi:RNA-directed DNA polymerase